ncbi:1-acyl-sn-glycerol-3-phosphate acyltransferase [Verrucomicrobia bacterium]|nr:1-acyl-sn-glycerol-3-phosphate acyltransferase [Verrucomicrobiota bacterium]
MADCPKQKFGFIYYITWGWFRLVFKLYFRWRIFNADRVPMQGSVILASNHASYLDPPMVGCAIHRESGYLARASLFRFSPFGWWIRKLNAVPVDRDGGVGKGLKTVFKLLDSNLPVTLFPEGTRSVDGQLQPAKPGIGMIIIKSDSPVIPVRVFGSYEAFGKNAFFPRPHRISIKYGDPINFSELRKKASTATKREMKDLYIRASEMCMEAIGKLEPHENQEKE